MVERARPAGVEAVPWLALARPVHEADGPGVERAAAAVDVVAAEAVLVPAVVDGLHLAGEDEQERGQGAQLVDALHLLDFHPALDALAVVPGAPAAEVDDHDAGVEVAGRAAAPREDAGAELRVRPERGREVAGEVGVAVLGRRHDGGGGEARLPEAPDVVGGEHVGVEVYRPRHAAREQVGQVVPRVVERRLERGAHGRRDEPGHGLGAERVDLEPQRRERRRDRAPQQLRLRVLLPVCLRGQEVEEDGLRAGRVLEQRVHRRHGATQVVRVQRHGDVHQARVAHPRRRSRAPFPVPVLRRLREPRQRPRGTRNLDGQEDHRRRQSSGPHRGAAHGRR